MKKFVIAAVFFASVAGHSEVKVGFQLERFEDPRRHRPVLIDWWYPSLVDQGGAAPEPFNYGLGSGEVVERGAVLSGRHPLIVLSHGSLGAARNYAWIAEALAADGYLVAGVSHFGESYVYGPETIDPAAVLRVRERPLDISAALTFIEQASAFSAAVDLQSIGFLGHSSGGATGIFLSGALFDERRLEQYCKSGDAKIDKGCGYADGGPARVDDRLGHKSYADRRVKAIVALDPALGPGFYNYEALDPHLPVLVVGSVDNDFLPFQHHALRISKDLEHSPARKNLQTQWLSEAEGHFVYLNECDLPFYARAVALCKDRPAVSRGAVHERLQEQILRFFRESL